MGKPTNRSGSWFGKFKDSVQMTVTDDLYMREDENAYSITRDSAVKVKTRQTTTPVLLYLQYM